MWLFQYRNLVPQAFPAFIPFAKWQEAANYEQFTNQPRKI